MSVPPRLSAKLNETLGPDAAEDLVTWLDEMRLEHRELREAIRADFAEMRQEMHAVETRLADRIQSLETSLRGEIHTVETRLGERLGDRIQAVEFKVEQRAADLIRWSFVFWVGAVAAIAVLAGVLRR